MVASFSGKQEAVVWLPPSFFPSALTTFQPFSVERAVVTLCFAFPYRPPVPSLSVPLLCCEILCNCQISPENGQD